MLLTDRVLCALISAYDFKYADLTLVYSFNLCPSGPKTLQSLLWCRCSNWMLQVPQRSSSDVVVGLVPDQL